MPIAVGLTAIPFFVERWRRGSRGDEDDEELSNSTSPTSLTQNEITSSIKDCNGTSSDEESSDKIVNENVAEVRDDIEEVVGGETNTNFSTASATNNTDQEDYKEDDTDDEDSQNYDYVPTSLKNLLSRQENELSEMLHSIDGLTSTPTRIARACEDELLNASMEESVASACQDELMYKGDGDIGLIEELAGVKRRLPAAEIATDQYQTEKTPTMSPPRRSSLHRIQAAREKWEAHRQRQKSLRIIELKEERTELDHSPQQDGPRIFSLFRRRRDIKQNEELPQLNILSEESSPSSSNDLYYNNWDGTDGDEFQSLLHQDKTCSNNNILILWKRRRRRENVRRLYNFPQNMMDDLAAECNEESDLTVGRALELESQLQQDMTQNDDVNMMKMKVMISREKEQEDILFDLWLQTMNDLDIYDYEEPEFGCDNKGWYQTLSKCDDGEDDLDLLPSSKMDVVASKGERRGKQIAYHTIVSSDGDQTEEDNLLRE